MTVTDLRRKGYLAKDCEKCLQAVILAKKPEGRWMQLDPSSKVYSIIELYVHGKRTPEVAENRLAFAEHKCLIGERDGASNHERGRS